MSYQTKVGMKQGGDTFFIKPGGKVVYGEGETDLNIGKRYLTLDIGDLSADTSYYLLSPYAGKITKIQSVIDGAVSSADVTITASINSNAVTGGVITVATTSSAAGDVDEAVPSAANTVAVGDKISFAVAGGGSGGSPRGHLLIEITAQ